MSNSHPPAGQLDSHAPAPDGKKTITIEEDYLEFHGQIYYAWRAEGAADWHFKLTPYKELPYVRWLKLNEIEYADRLRRYGLPTADKGDNHA